MVEMSLCGLGQTAPLPLLGGLRYFLSEFEEHINQKHCRTGSCEVLVQREMQAQGRRIEGALQQGWIDERYLPARMGERYRAMMGAITQEGSSGNGTAAKPAKTVQR